MKSWEESASRRTRSHIFTRPDKNSGKVSEKLLCLSCGIGLEPSDSAGRPSSYCSPGCRRAAQSERQRIVRHLSRFEEERMELRHSVQRKALKTVLTKYGYVTVKERLKDVESDLTELRARLQALCEEE